MGDQDQIACLEKFKTIFHQKDGTGYLGLFTCIYNEVMHLKLMHLMI